MLVSVLSILAVVFTVLRSWPQFGRIVVKKERASVSVMTWTLALSSHVGWFMYGVLSPVPLFIVVNILAGAGCAATVWTMRSGKPVAVVTAASVIASVLAFVIADAALLTLITILSFAMFIPQLLKVFRSSGQGVSLASWTLAAAASTTWIAYAWAIHRPSVVIAHFFMLPAALVIIARTLVASSRSGVPMPTVEPVG